jgi:hypothetical protein
LRLQSPIRYSYAASSSTTAQSSGFIPVATVKHHDKRANIPTEELRHFLAGEEKDPKPAKPVKFHKVINHYEDAVVKAYADYLVRRLLRNRRFRRAAAVRVRASSSAAYRQITRRIARVRPGVCGKRSRVVTINLTTSFFWRRWRLAGIRYRM